jgi:penicillin-binding protein 1C
VPTAKDLYRTFKSKSSKTPFRGWGRLFILLILLTWFWLSLPDQLFNSPTSYVIEDKDGNLLNASIASDGQWRFPAGKKVPPKFIDCITTFEDKRFFYHPGVDPIAVGRAS